MKLSNNLRHISEDKVTVKNNPQMKNFKIFHQHSDVAHITLPSNSTVQFLMEQVRQKLAQKNYPIEKILFLESMNGEEVLDYALQIPTYQIANLRNNENLNLVMCEELMGDSWISLNDFKFKKCLGQGASASVFLVRHRGNGKLYALKQIQKNYFVEFKRMEQVLREKKIMAEIINNFPFVANLYASFQSDKHLNFLMEFYPGGEMFYHLQKRRLDETEAKLYFAQMVLIFQLLHHQKVIYRDLKNIMIDFNGHARLTDFGLCKINIEKEDLTTSYCGSIEYMAPEIKESNGYNYSVDFYTLGAFLYEMVMGVPPYYNNQPLFFNQFNSSTYKALVKGLIEEDVNNRIKNFKNIKSSKWLAEINWQDIMKGAYHMPFDVNPYQTYIHQEFRNVHVNQYNCIHQDKYDHLFDFFTFFKDDPNNQDLINCYHPSTHASNHHFSKQATLKIGVPVMKKKEKKNRSSGSNSYTNNSKSKKESKEKGERKSSRGKSQRGNLNEKNNIYVRKGKQDGQQFRSVSPKLKTAIVFKKTGKLNSSKSGLDIMKQVMKNTSRY